MGTLHGVTRLVLLALAMLVGLIGAALDSPAAALGGTVLRGVSILVICGVYCA